jgi:hypothetical protein
MSDESSGVPTTWPELLAGGYAQRSLEHLDSVVEMWESDSFGSPPNELGTREPFFASAAVVLGAEALRPKVERIKRMIEFSAERLNDEPDGYPVRAVIGCLSTLNAVECVGLIEQPFAGADAAKIVAAVVKNMEDLNEPVRHTAGLAAVAAGRADLVAKCVGGGKLPARFTPHETFLFNVPGFVRYLAVASSKGGSADDVKPAWIDFVRAFPRKLGADTLGWQDLLWAGRIYYHLFEKQPVAQVADAVRELVSQA